MKTEYVWGIVSLILLIYSLLKVDIVFIVANLGFLLFNIYQLKKRNNNVR